MIRIACAAFAAVLIAFPAASKASLPISESKPTRSAALSIGIPDQETTGLARPAPTPANLREEIRSLARQGNLDSALVLCRQALEIDSGDTFARFMSGKLAPEGKASGDHFRQVLESGKPGPEAEESRFRLGQFHYAAGRYHLAIPNFREYVKLHPRGDWKEPAHYWMGSACLSLVQSRPDKSAYLDTAALYFQRLLDMTPNDQYYHALALEGTAKVRMAKGDWAGAWEAARSALDKAPEDERASILLLAAQLRRGADREEERRLLARLASEHPQSPEVRHLRKINGSADPSRWRAPAVPGAPKLIPVQDSTTQVPTAGTVAPALPNPGVTVPAAAQPTAQPTAQPAAQPAAQAAASAASPGQGGFTLQLGAFAQAANAQGLMAELTKKGFTPETVESLRGGKRIYQVRLGRFPSAEEALEYARVNLKPRKILSQPIQLP